jgi:hypothetical protein
MSCNPLCKLSTIITLPEEGTTDMLLLRARAYLISWASDLATEQQQAFTKQFLFTKFKEHFTPVDRNVPQLTVDDLDFEYAGDGIFTPYSQQGLIATEKYDNDDHPFTTIEFLFDVENDSKSMHTLHIIYEGRDEYQLTQRVALRAAHLDPHYDK